MSRTLLAGALLLAVGACAPAARAPLPAGGAVVADGTPPAEYPTAAPAVGEAQSLTLPRAVERQLPNGLRVLYVQRPQLPIVQALLVTGGGTTNDPAAIPGLASFTAELLDEGAGGRDALALADAVEQLGASLGTGADWEGGQVSLQVLRPRLPEALRLMADVAFRPDFPEAEIRRIRDERLTNLARARDLPGAIAANAFSTLVFGADHPYGRSSSTESLRRIDRAALVDFHRRHYTPVGATLVLVGDVDESVHAMVEQAFGPWTGAAESAVVAPAPPAPAATRIFLVDKPGAVQSEVRIGHPGAARGTDDFYALQVLNVILGGSFTSRLNQNLRETHGYSYGAGSAFGLRRGVGPFVAQAAVVATRTDSSLVQFFHELNRIRDQAVPADELERAKGFITLGLPRSFETNAQIAGRLADLVTHDLPLDYYDSYVQRINAVTAADLQRVARQYLQPDRSVVVVVGDRETVEEGIRGLGLAPVELRPLEEFVR